MTNGNSTVNIERLAGDKIRGRRGKKAKAKLLGSLCYHLWRGRVSQASQILKDYRPEAKRLDKLDELIVYLDARHPFIPNYLRNRVNNVSSSAVDMPKKLMI